MCWGRARLDGTRITAKYIATLFESAQEPSEFEKLHSSPSEDDQ